MQLAFTYETLVIIGLGAVAVLVVFVIYHRFFYRKVKTEEARLLALHFVVDDFIEDSKPATFRYYNKKFERFLFLFVIFSGASIVGPRFVDIPSPFDVVISAVGSLMTVASLVVLNITERENERARNINRPMGSAHVLYPEQGEVGQLLKRMTIESEVILSEDQYKVLIDDLISAIKKLKSYKKDEVDEAKLREKWLTRLKKNRVYRIRVDKYRLLLVTQSDFERMKTPDTKPMIDETVEVNVNTVPMFLLYVGPSRRIFRAKDDTGKSMFTDRVMGVFVDLFDLAQRDELLLKGDFTALSKTDALLAEFLHLYEQRSATATEMTKTLRDLEKANAEIEEKEFDHDAESNRLMTSAKNLLKIVSSLVTPEPMTKKDYGFWILLFALGMLVGRLLP